MSVPFLSDVGAAQIIDRSQENFKHAGNIIGEAFKADLFAIAEVETYLNQQEVFLEATQETLNWEQDQSQTPRQFHFVLAGKKDGRDNWLASDARYVRSRLADIVQNLANQLQSLKTAY